MIVLKGVFNKIEFEENTEKKGEIERFPEIPRYTPLEAPAASQNE